jgi:hypothetical protein
LSRATPRGTHHVSFRPKEKSAMKALVYHGPGKKSHARKVLIEAE